MILVFFLTCKECIVMKREAMVIVFLAASLVFGGTSHAAGISHWASRGKTIVNKVVNLGSLPNRAAGYFTTPVEGGYSPLQKTLAAGTFALACWSAGLQTGCNPLPHHSQPGYRQAVAMRGYQIALVVVVVVGVIVVGSVAAGSANNNSPGFIISEASFTDNQLEDQLTTVNWHNIQQRSFLANNSEVVEHSMSINNEPYRGVLVTYNDGVDTRVGLAFSPDTPLVFSLISDETEMQGNFGFMSEDPSFQPPEDIIIKHLDGETPDAVISLTQVENVLFKSQPTNNLVENIWLESEDVAQK